METMRELSQGNWGLSSGDYEPSTFLQNSWAQLHKLYICDEPMKLLIPSSDRE